VTRLGELSLGFHFGQFFNVTIDSTVKDKYYDKKQGCQMVCFQTKNPNLGKFWRVLQWKILVYFMDTWSILQSSDIFYGHLV
jgi:hypothetical protein